MYYLNHWQGIGRKLPELWDADGREDCGAEILLP